MADDKGVSDGESKESSPPPAVVKKKGKGVLSRIWHAIFGSRGDNFEKRLEHITKEEKAVVARIKRRSQAWRTIIRHLIVFSVVLEVIAVAYAIMMTRSEDLNWKMRAFRVSPVFLLPVISSIVYSAVVKITRMCDQRDQKSLENLRAERRAKIDELKEKTNYYITQQLIQRYDPDPAAKAAAATILASKLGADSGLKVYLEDESKLDVLGGRSNDVELVPSSGLRKRKHSRSNSTGSTPLVHSNEGSPPHPVGNEGPQASEHERLVVDHYHPQGPSVQDGGWLARIAALLVGEDPTQSYALICGNCHRHNGLARKEDFPYITYYCPHCQALNKPKQPEEHVSRSSPIMDPLQSGVGDAVKSLSGSMAEDILRSSGPVISGSEIEKVMEKVESSDVVG
ncbi:hypothetical protein J1N35_045351 [Gossypium stocksii]|uniref:Lunapark zinc ribbon domain-containing protein n=1 Tax=Gossypium stocksii TaxID=47602 RepID=A0A9D3UAZ7_9ROSI|nr:hypothetical protein J1N35_045351 [Gossypium stocksii]